MQRHFERELERLKTNLIRMGSLVDDQIDLAMKALFDMNVGLARLVIERDEKVNEYDNLIDKEIETIFATTQPVAVDLRLLMAALKMNSDLERIGDIAQNLAERAESLARLEGDGKARAQDLIQRTRIASMAEAARQMVRDAIDSFINGDAKLGRTICERDDIVDDYDRENFGLLIQAMQDDPRTIEAGANLIVVSRHIERLADHATNIAEDVVFLIDAKIIKHHGIEMKEEP
ncbi:MAG: phosphate signaling complex protein PhoU [Bacteroidota bacterium]